MNEEGLTLASLYEKKSRKLIEIHEGLQTLLLTLYLSFTPFHSLPVTA